MCILIAYTPLGGQHIILEKHHFFLRIENLVQRVNNKVMRWEFDFLGQDRKSLQSLIQILRIGMLRALPRVNKIFLCWSTLLSITTRIGIKKKWKSFFSLLWRAVIFQFCSIFGGKQWWVQISESDPNLTCLYSIWKSFVLDSSSNFLGIIYSIIFKSNIDLRWSNAYPI